ncbi:MAG: prolyl oligopeptidase family serine peptidase [Pirellulaceae bacterium]|nr:prolyl oligopeptidase family serine peptidase [Pirellulaceae bacterium]
MNKALMIGCAMFFGFQTVQCRASWKELLETRVHRGENEAVLPYRLMKPERVESDKRYPLVLFLHGAGERGNDNDRQLVHCAAEFAKDENRRKYPCFFVAPQCPAGKSWAELDWKQMKLITRDEPTEPLRLALDLVDKLAAELPVDPRRIYVTGLSMGGFGTWDAAARRPGFFAAAVPICGGGDLDRAAKLKDMPIWAFHGDADPVVPLAQTTTMIEAIRKAGGEPKMTVYPGVGHNSWADAYADPELSAWLFSKIKPVEKSE